MDQFYTWYPDIEPYTRVQAKMLYNFKHGKTSICAPCLARPVFSFMPKILCETFSDWRKKQQETVIDKFEKYNELRLHDGKKPIAFTTFDIKYGKNIRQAYASLNPKPQREPVFETPMANQWFFDMIKNCQLNGIPEWKIEKYNNALHKACLIDQKIALHIFKCTSEINWCECFSAFYQNQINSDTFKQKFEWDVPNILINFAQLTDRVLAISKKIGKGEILFPFMVTNDCEINRKADGKDINVFISVNNLTGIQMKSVLTRGTPVRCGQEKEKTFRDNDIAKLFNGVINMTTVAYYWPILKPQFKTPRLFQEYLNAEFIKCMGNDIMFIFYVENEQKFVFMPINEIDVCGIDVTGRWSISLRQNALISAIKDENINASNQINEIVVP